MDSAALSSSFPVPRHDVPPAHWSISGVGQLGPSAAHTSGPVFPVPGFPVNVMRPELLRRSARTHTYAVGMVETLIADCRRSVLWMSGSLW